MKGFTLLCVYLLSICYCHAFVGLPSILATISDELDNLNVSDEELTLDIDLSKEFDDSANKTCNVAVFEKCSVALTKELNITTPIRSAKDFVKALHEIIEKEHQDGFKRLCKAYNKYRKCLGNDFSACINVDFITKRGIKRKDAYIYVTVVNQFVYQCTPTPFKIVLDNWDCINSTQPEARHNYKKCVKEFMKRVKKHPRTACPLAQKLVTCVDIPWGKRCNKSVNYVMCNTMKAVLRAFLPKCNIMCPNLTLNSDNFASNQEDIENVQEDDDNDSEQMDNESTSIAHQSPFSVGFLSQISDGSLQCCDLTKFKKAIYHFVQLYGFEKLPSNATEFVKAVQNLNEKEGKFGFKKTCQASKEFYERLGRDQYNLCVSKNNLESLGYSPSNVLTYLVTAASLFYDCGEGYEVYYSNFDCITTTSKRNIDEIKQCMTDFQTNVTKDPTHICDFSQSLLLCFGKPYKENCGRDVGRLMCMTGKAEMNQVSSACKSLSCDTDGSSPIINGSEIKTFGDGFNSSEDFWQTFD